MPSSDRFITVSLLFIFSITHLFGSEQIDERPEKVYRYCYVVKSKEWYRTQDKLWQEQLALNPVNEDAWYNYFFAARYGWANIAGQTQSREVLLDSIYKAMGDAIPNSWVYHYIHYYNYASDFKRLEKAYQINPNAPDLYWEFIKEYELSGQRQLKNEFCMKLYRSKDISTGIYNINHNILNSTQYNSILFTNGDNDTYPAWVLQEAKGIRSDVLVLNIHAIFGDRKYLTDKLSEIGINNSTFDLSETDVAMFFKQLILLINQEYPDLPIHIAQTVYQPYYQNFENQLFLTGIVYTFHATARNHISIHKDIIENNLRLDYLDNDWYDDLHISKPLVDQLNLLYVEPFLKYAQYFYGNNYFEKSKIWKNKALILAKKANETDLIKDIESRKF